MCELHNKYPHWVAVVAVSQYCAVAAREHKWATVTFITVVCVSVCVVPVPRATYPVALRPRQASYHYWYRCCRCRRSGMPLLRLTNAHRVLIPFSWNWLNYAGPNLNIWIPSRCRPGSLSVVALVLLDRGSQPVVSAWGLYCRDTIILNSIRKGFWQLVL